MGVVLYRIDERLIHGQVVIGWGSELRPARYLVVDDEVAASAWEQELYRLGAGDAADVEFASTERARDRLAAWQGDDRRSILLTRDVATMLELAETGLLEGLEVNVGGIHHAAGRTQVRPYVYLDDADRARLAALADRGVQVSARDLPGSARVPASTLVKP